MSKITINEYKSIPEWNNMEIKGKWSTWGISSYPDGDVEIECASGHGSENLILNQDELKQFIAFLQTKIK
jgi:hypothetical protein